MKDKITRIAGMWQNLLNENSTISTKSFTLLLSAIVGAFIGMCLCFALVYDVITNGYIKTDLADAGVFLLCTGGYMAGAGFTKAMVDMKKVTHQNNLETPVDAGESENNIENNE